MSTRNLKKFIKKVICIQVEIFKAMSTSATYTDSCVKNMLINYAKSLCIEFREVTQKALKQFVCLSEKQRHSKKLKEWLKLKLPDYKGCIIKCMDIMHAEAKDRIRTTR